MKRSTDSSNEVVLRRGTSGDAGMAGDIAVAAWESIYAARRQLVGSDIFDHLWEGWAERKRKNVENHFRSHPKTTIVTETSGVLVGFLTYQLDPEKKLGEIGNNAVDPDYTEQGIGTLQCRKALQIFKDEGMEYSSVTTGLDDGHAPARRMYEKAGFDNAVPMVTYYQKLK